MKYAEVPEVKKNYRIKKSPCWCKWRYHWGKAEFIYLDRTPWRSKWAQHPDVYVWRGRNDPAKQRQMRRAR